MHQKMSKRKLEWNCFHCPLEIRRYHYASIIKSSIKCSDRVERWSSTSQIKHNIYYHFVKGSYHLTSEYFCFDCSYSLELIFLKVSGNARELTVSYASYYRYAWAYYLSMVRYQEVKRLTLQGLTPEEQYVMFCASMFHIIELVACFYLNLCNYVESGKSGWSPLVFWNIH